MGYKMDDIRDTSPLSIKRINDNFRTLTTKVDSILKILSGSVSTVYVSKADNLQNGSYTITLPVKFKSKNYSVGISVVRAAGVSGAQPLKSFNARLNEITASDKLNGTFSITVEGSDNAGENIILDIFYTVIV